MTSNPEDRLAAIRDRKLAYDEALKSIKASKDAEALNQAAAEQQALSKWQADCVLLSDIVGRMNDTLETAGLALQIEHWSGERATDEGKLAGVSVFVGERRPGGNAVHFHIRRHKLQLVTVFTPSRSTRSQPDSIGIDRADAAFYENTLLDFLEQAIPPTPDKSSIR